MGPAGPDTPSQNTTRASVDAIAETARSPHISPDAPDPDDDPDLSELIAKWPHLHPATKLHIMSLITSEADPDGY